MTRFVNVATPFTAVAVAVVAPPLNVPPFSVSVTVLLLVGSVLPEESVTATETAGKRPVPVWA